MYPRMMKKCREQMMHIVHIRKKLLAICRAWRSITKLTKTAEKAKRIYKEIRDKEDQLADIELKYEEDRGNHY